MDEYLRLTPAPGGAVSERMQALLSRAVEEQVNEQRQVQSLLSDVRSALADVQNDSRGSPGEPVDVRADLANYATDTRSQLALLDERLEALVRTVGTSAQVLQGISGQLERLAELLREQASSAGRIEPVVQVRREVADLRGRFDAVEATVRGDVAALQERLGADVDRLHRATEESSRTIANHVDNAVLVLAEALLRRPISAGASATAPVPDLLIAPEPAVVVQPEQAVADEPISPVASAAGDPPDDDPLWGASFRVPPTEAAPDELVLGTTVSSGELPAIDDEPVDGSDEEESGALVDADRPISLPSWSGGRPSNQPAYADPLADLPVAAEQRPGLGVPATAPYDLERALFGDRSRPAADADTRAEPAVATNAAAPSAPADTAPTDTTPTDSAPTGVASAEPGNAAEHNDPHSPDQHSLDQQSQDSDEGAPDLSRRKPWWRPSN